LFIFGFENFSALHLPLVRRLIFPFWASERVQKGQYMGVGGHGAPLL
jgi:hypothetical protein